MAACWRGRSGPGRAASSPLRMSTTSGSTWPAGRWHRPRGSERPVAELVNDAPATVLAVYAHPDDPDVSAGGTLARWAADGSSVHVCICADGDKGSLDPRADPARLVARRREEVAAAGAILGVKEHHWLGFRDGEID